MWCATYAGGVTLLSLQANVFSLVLLALLVFKVVAFVAALRYPAEAYTAADKMTKPAWAIILGVCVVADILLGLGILWVISTVAAIVFWVDVRPALKAVLGYRR